MYQEEDEKEKIQNLESLIASNTKYKIPMK
jgi:hypothetical protein